MIRAAPVRKRSNGERVKTPDRFLTGAVLIESRFLTGAALIESRFLTGAVLKVSHAYCRWRTKDP